MRPLTVVAVRVHVGGHHTRTIQLEVAGKGYCSVACSADGGLLAIANTATGQITLRSLSAAVPEHRIGKSGTGNAEFSGLSGVCFTPSGDILAADRNNKRLQLLRAGGAHVRSYAAGKRVSCAATNGVVVLAGIYADDLKAGDNAVLSFELESGAKGLQFGRVGPDTGCLRSCASLKFAPDMAHVVAADPLGGRVLLYNLSGVCIHSINMKPTFVGAQTWVVFLRPDHGTPVDAVVTPDGHVVSIDAAPRLVLTCPLSSDTLATRLPGPPLASPLALCATAREVFVLDGSSVHVFE